MKKALFITLKEVRDFLQDKGDLSFSLVLPILIFALMYGAFGGNLQFNGTANVVNEDAGGKYSTLLLQRLDNVKGLTVQTMSASDADSKLSRSSIQMAVFIPQGFSDKLAANQPTQLVFKQRGNGGTEGQIVSSIVRGAAEGIGQNLQLQNLVKSDLSNTNITPQQIQVTVQDLITQEQSSPAVAVTENTLGSNPDPVNQFLPGIMTMFVLFAVNLTAQALVDERRKGTLERLLATRLTVGELFSGKFLAYMARGFIQTTILLLLAYAVFRIFTPVSFLESLVLALLFAAACSAIGLIIGSLAKSQNQATWISVFFTMLMVMISGTFVALTPGTTLETLSHLSINTYANDAFRALITQGGSLADVKTDIFVMLGVAVIGLIVSRFLFRATQQGGK
jgi:ABC-2 type transport system permease protein